ncbi:SPOR domain-containing protein [Rhodobacter capsulatus]|uniref:Sporulation related domain-containing protein n=1 Tax=Rhodobacter capsulatus TaxID=1061 RepID=A0A1G7INV7_RHOCA|nr:SPOR domain-containing protein [Rhodobacter capsulatus]WER10275.1 SPOR domain-containing protein [Rhodobacter capsulatus]SDF14351.1 Sporulation related domain-containing protein [Rhodobacter capsulatus]
MTDPDTRNGGGFGRQGGGYYGPGLDMPAPQSARWVQLAGAAVSGALILGVIVWGYRLAVRDVSGVPVIRALEGPARMAPSDPGGDLAAHVGLAVNEVAGSGLAAPGPSRVVLAPPPTGLSPDDAPMSELKPLPQVDRPADAEDLAMEGPPVPVPDSALPAKPALAAPVADPAAELPTDPEPPAETALTETAPAETAVEPPPAETAAAEPVIPADVPGVVKSPRPLARPDLDIEAEAAAQAVAAALAGPETVELKAADLPSGTRVVQLGAFDSPEEARAEWGRISGRFEALMAGKKRIVQEAASGGRSFWRLRVSGFKGVEEARQFCAALVAEGANCIPTVIK